MSEESRSVRIPLVVLGAVVLWTTAVGLMTYDTMLGNGRMAEWAIITSAAAATWSVVAAQCMSRVKTVNHIVRKLVLHEQASKLTQI